MRISFNIPTYNRSDYLKKNLEIILSQIYELHKENEVEINISDNASTDNTEIICNAFISKNKSIHINYNRNNENLGPDANFINSMKMATGDYSLLWGDDDFLKEGGLRRIFELVNFGESNDIQIMLSSTSIYDRNGRYLKEKQFLRNDIDELIVDFSDLNQARSYFFLLKDMGGLLSFISDVVYKTSIIKELPFYNEFMGTHYAFLCYWWGWLAKGKKLYYSNQSFLMETIQYQPAYGYGIDRIMVDYIGYSVIKEKLLTNCSYKLDFLNAFQNLHNTLNVLYTVNGDKKKFDNLLVPQLLKFGMANEEINVIKKFCSFKSVGKLLLYTIIPQEIVLYLKTKIKR